MPFILNKMKLGLQTRTRAKARARARAEAMAVADPVMLNLLFLSGGKMRLQLQQGDASAAAAAVRLAFPEGSLLFLRARADAEAVGASPLHRLVGDVAHEVATSVGHGFSRPPGVCLVFAGQPLEPLRTLSSYNIQNESILTAVVEDPPVQFYVQCQEPVGVVYGRCWDTIGDLKAHLEARTSRPHLHLGIPVDQQRLTLADRTRDLDEDDKTLADYNIGEGSGLLLRWR